MRAQPGARSRACCGASDDRLGAREDEKTGGMVDTDMLAPAFEVKLGVACLSAEAEASMTEATPNHHDYGSVRMNLFDPR